jgi:pimeloyl-ACP methyl ester carboxylesterase
MRRVFEENHDLDAVIEDFHAPFTGPMGSWRLMSLLRWGSPAETLAAVPALLPDLHIPTLVMHGSHDPAVPVRFAAQASELIPNAEKIIVDCGHFLPLNEPELIANHLLGFFALQSTPIAPAVIAAN